jgi:hypothetical protein
MDEWTTFFVGLALSAALFALGVVLYPRLKRERQGYPFEAAIEAALLPVIYQGICAAYRLSEKSVDELHQRLGARTRKQSLTVSTVCCQKRYSILTST